MTDRKGYGDRISLGVVSSASLSPFEICVCMWATVNLRNHFVKDRLFGRRLILERKNERGKMKKKSLFSRTPQGRCFVLLSLSKNPTHK